jgi:hypothetical protein
MSGLTEVGKQWVLKSIPSLKGEVQISVVGIEQKFVRICFELCGVDGCLFRSEEVRLRVGESARLAGSALTLSLKVI